MFWNGLVVEERPVAKLISITATDLGVVRTLGWVSS